MHALMNLPDEKKHHDLATDGIEIHSGFHASKCEAEFTLFDFAGQELYVLTWHYAMMTLQVLWDASVLLRRRGVAPDCV